MSEVEFHIEFARYSDASTIGAISKNNIEYGLGWHYTPEKIIKLINNKSKNVVVARKDDELIGFGIMTYYYDQANLDLLAVKLNYRRKKIGTHIVSWLEKVAITAGAFNIFVQARATNIPAIEFYKKLGFIVLDREDKYYRKRAVAIIMSKNLRSMLNVTHT
jgi:ribosomal-protein-alanine N-acetyltransferase